MKSKLEIAENIINEMTYLKANNRGGSWEDNGGLTDDEQRIYQESLKIVMSELRRDRRSDRLLK
jgi:hypothetical protein